MNNDGTRSLLACIGMHKFLCVAFLAVGAAVPLAVAAQEAAERSGNPPLQEPLRGQVGYGVSVFEGTELERFEVEFLGRLGGFAVGEDYILARLTGANLEESGVIAGMSGSPVYVKNELVGAVAFAWPFAKEAIGGITPIGSMRRQLLELRPGASSSGGATGASTTSWGDLLQVGDPEAVLQRWTRKLLPKASVVGPSAVQLATSALPPKMHEWMQANVGSIAPIGRSPVDSQLEPGSAVAGILVDGDWQMAVTGTVTDVVGDRILAFGHPFLATGATNMPMAPAEIVVVVPSRASSFKLSNFGEPVGGFDTDVSTGVGGRVGDVPEMVPLEVSLAGAERPLSMRLAKVSELVPTLIGLGLFQSTGAAGHQGGTYGLDLTATFDLGDYGELRLISTHDGPSAVVSAAVLLIQYADFLHNNSWADSEIRGVRLAVEQHTRPITVSILGARASRRQVAPGETLDVTVELKGYRETAEQRQLQVQIPPDLRPGSYSLLVGDGRSVDLATWQVTGEEPRDFERSLELLRQLRSSRHLAVAGLRLTSGLSVRGVGLPELPGSMTEILRRGQDTKPVVWRIHNLLDQPSMRPLSGVARIDLEIVPDAEADVSAKVMTSPKNGSKKR